MTTTTGDRPIDARIEYPERLSRLSTFFRWLPLIPASLLALLAALPLPLLTLLAFLPIVIAKVYPRWIFNLVVALLRFQYRFAAYSFLLTDRFPLSDDPSVHFAVAHPQRDDLTRVMPLLKWILVIPHRIVLYFLSFLLVPALIVAWMSVVASGKYPRPVFRYVLGLKDWQLRVTAYSQLLITDVYPPYAFNELFSGGGGEERSSR